MDLPGGLVAKTPHSQCKGAWVRSPASELDAATKSLHAAPKIEGPMGCNQDPVQPNK